MAFQRNPLPCAVVHRIESMILEGQIKEGERLKENHLSKVFQVSQTTIREALRVLENRGFVRHHPNKGTFVVSLTSDDFGQLFEVRLILESEALELASKRASPKEKERLHDLLRLLSLAAEHKDLLKYHEAHMNFHSYLWSLSHNKYLAETLQRLVFPLWAFYEQRVYSRQKLDLSGRRTHNPLVLYIDDPSFNRSADQIIREHIKDVAGLSPRQISETEEGR